MISRVGCSSMLECCKFKGIIFAVIGCLFTINDTFSSDQNALTAMDNKDCIFSGSFQQTRQITGLNDALDSSGQFFYHCNYGVIWKTTEPLTETLVLSKTDKNYQLQGDEIKRIRSRYSKILSKLIINMMGSDKTQTSKDFEINQTEQSVILTPNRKRIQRAIKSIEISDLSTQETERRQVLMTDPNDRIIKIISTKQTVFAEQTAISELAKQCSDIAVITTKECELLLTE